MLSKTGAVALWLLFALVVTGIVVQVSVLPPVEAGWRARGIMPGQLHWTWQLVVDGADFSMHRGAFVALPLLIAAAFMTKSAFKRSSC